MAGTMLGALQPQNTQTNREGTGFQSLALFCGTEIMWSHSETGIIGGEALSSRYCVTAWSVGEATLGKTKEASRYRPAVW